MRGLSTVSSGRHPTATGTDQQSDNRMATLKVALLQLVSASRDIEANLRKGDSFCRQAAASEAHIALFPELWNIGCSGFSPQDARDRQAWASLAIARDDPFV